MKILSATVFLSLGMAIGTAISAVAGGNAAHADARMGEARSVELQPLFTAEIDHVPVQILDEQLPAEAGGTH